MVSGLEHFHALKLPCVCVQVCYLLLLRYPCHPLGLLQSQVLGMFCPLISPGMSHVQCHNSLQPSPDQMNKITVICKWYEPSSISSLLNVIVWVSVVLKRTVDVDSEWCFKKPEQKSSSDSCKLWITSWWYICLIVVDIGQFNHDVNGW